MSTVETGYCQRCSDRIPRLEGSPLSSDRGLSVHLYGSYGEFYDSITGSLYFDLCHGCGHALANFLGLDTAGWHPERMEP